MTEELIRLVFRQAQLTVFLGTLFWFCIKYLYAFLRDWD
jgi:hypothetical protein